MEVKAPQLPKTSTIITVNIGGMGGTMPAHALENFQVKVGTFCLRVLRKPLILLISIGAKRRAAAEASRLRWIEIRKFQETPEMTQAQADQYFADKAAAANYFRMSVEDVNRAFIRLHQAGRACTIPEKPIFK